MEISIVNTIKALILLEFPTNQPITAEEVRSQYRKLCLVYHPDQTIERYKDGEKFKEVKEAQEYLLNNISVVNKQIASEFIVPSNKADNGYAQWQESKRREAEAEERRRRAAEESQRKAQAEEARKRAAEASRRKAEEDARRKAQAEEARRQAEDTAHWKAEAEKKQKEAEARKAADKTLERMGKFALVICAIFIIPVLIVSCVKSISPSESLNIPTQAIINTPVSEEVVFGPPVEIQATYHKYKDEPNTLIIKNKRDYTCFVELKDSTEMTVLAFEAPPGASRIMMPVGTWYAVYSSGSQIPITANPEVFSAWNATKPVELVIN